MLVKYLKSLYNVLPNSFQDILVGIYGWYLYKQRYGKEYYKFYEFYKNKDCSNKIDNEAEQNELLCDFLKFVVENSSFYKRKYSAVDLSKIKGVSDLHLLPVLSKEELRTNIKDISTIKSGDGVTSFTGGTTGKSLEVNFTSRDFQRRMAYLDAFKFKVGVDPFKSKKATFSGRQLISKPKGNVYWRNNFAYNQRLYSTFHISEKNLPLYINNLNEYKPEVINGFVSSIYELAKYINENNLILDFSPKAIFTTSETLLSHHREVIQSAFKCHIYNQYASAEGAPFITECVEGELHYNIDTGVIETSPESGSILVTSFTTHGTPLVRYDIGDSISFKDGVCKCGSAHPLVSEISGRAVDFLIASNGTKVSLSHLADVIKGLPGCIRNIQFTQTSVTKISILLEVDEDTYDLSHEKILLNSLAYRFTKATDFEISKVEKIPREASGKYRLIRKL